MAERLPLCFRGGYQHGDRKGCFRDTRETVLKEIELRIKGFDRSPVSWLNGLAGTGKTTVVQTVSECVFAEGLRGAFFLRSRDCNGGPFTKYSSDKVSNV